MSNILQREIAREQIKYQWEGSQFILEIPASFFALHQFNQALLVATGLEKTIKLEKAVLNDYNEDLKLLKLINKNPDLLSHINQQDLQKHPHDKLNYVDLKFVITQPGRYEQFRDLFDLSIINEESQQSLRRESRVQALKIQ